MKMNITGVTILPVEARLGDLILSLGVSSLPPAEPKKAVIKIKFPIILRNWCSSYFMTKYT